LCSIGAAPAPAALLREPPVFASVDGVLDIVIVAKPAAVPLGGERVTGWVYEVCRRIPATRKDCDGAADAVQPYGGVRLALQPGDRLKARLVNRLPPSASTNPMLATNPTNLHTHGMIVEPRRKGNGRDTYGDYAFVFAYNTKNGPFHAHPGMEAERDAIEYEIDVPRQHPSGLFWFHPHAHGLSLGQVTSGLSGIITVGRVADYARRTTTSRRPIAVRHLVLKDAQVGPNGGAILTDPDSRLCAAGARVRPGSCTSHDGTWFFTINGQLDPELRPASDGEIWRITNASANVTYDLELGAPDGAVPFQVVAIDGISISAEAATKRTALRRAFAGKLEPVDCPFAARMPAHAPVEAVCARHLLLMPSSRAEIWVARDRAGAAVLRTRGYSTGTDGDPWPRMDLARVQWTGPPEAAPLAVFGQAAPLIDAGLLAPRGPTATAAAPPRPPGAPGCRMLPPGHQRRIIFGVPAADAKRFGLGYQELDAAGRVVGDEPVRVVPFEEAPLSVCVRLGSNDAPVTERWELVNIAREVHNFHIHQTEFRVVGGAARHARESAVLHDNVPIPAGSDGCDGTVATWRRSRACKPGVVRVEIPFSQPGQFVYHCHILEHEDGGMMAKIRVLPFATTVDPWRPPGGTHEDAENEAGNVGRDRADLRLRGRSQ
jgi:FtsP/CotA-like multicopper oxidase with cupredoxin domain